MSIPLLINLKDKKIGIFGLGEVGKRRAKKFRDKGAHVIGFDKEKKNLENIKTKKIEISEKNIPNLKKFFLIVLSMDNKKLEQELSKKAKSKKVLVNWPGNFEKGDVIVPATANISDGTVSITTEGKNPKKVKKIRKMIENEFS